MSRIDSAALGSRPTLCQQDTMSAGCQQNVNSVSGTQGASALVAAYIRRTYWPAEPCGVLSTGPSLAQGGCIAPAGLRHRAVTAPGTDGTLGVSTTTKKDPTALGDAPQLCCMTQGPESAACTSYNHTQMHVTMPCVHKACQLAISYTLCIKHTWMKHPGIAPRKPNTRCFHVASWRAAPCQPCALCPKHWSLPDTGRSPVCSSRLQQAHAGGKPRSQMCAAQCCIVLHSLTAVAWPQALV
jgi:hypothetical protein